VQDMVNIFKALSEETRLRILKLLESGELCVCDIVSSLDMSQPKVSFHLNALKEAGLIADRKQGKWTHYRIESSDMFRRFLVLAVLEKTPQAAAAADRDRLDMFLQTKRNASKLINAKAGGGCCGSLTGLKRNKGESKS